MFSISISHFLAWTRNKSLCFLPCLPCPPVPCLLLSLIEKKEEKKQRRKAKIQKDEWLSRKRTEKYPQKVEKSNGKWIMQSRKKFTKIKWSGWDSNPRGSNCCSIISSNPALRLVKVVLKRRESGNCPPDAMEVKSKVFCKGDQIWRIHRCIFA